MSQCYDIEEVIADQFADLSAQQIADDVMSALQGHPDESEALRLLAEGILTRQAQIKQPSNAA